MKSRFLTRALGKAVCASALLAGTLGVVGAIGTTAAHASLDGAIELYVNSGPTGTDGTNTFTGNNCELASNPCKTISFALAEENHLDSGTGVTGSVINIAAGTYGSGGDSYSATGETLFEAISAGNDNTTITGTSKKAKKVIIAPSDATHQIFGEAIVQLGGLSGITVENMLFNGLGVVGSIYSAIDIGIGSTADAAVGNIIESDAPFGILIDGSSAHPAGGIAISNDIASISKPCTTKVKGPDTGLNADWTAPANLLVAKVPACAGSGDASFTGVVINGETYVASPSPTKNTIILTSGGTVPEPEIPDGSTVTFNTSLEVASFFDVGIACGVSTDSSSVENSCAISDNTVMAGGTTYDGTHGSDAPVGILVTNNATADVDGNSVSDVASTTCSINPTECGIGIALAADATSTDSAGDTTVGALITNPNTPTAKSTGNGNTLSGNDTGIAVQGGANTATYNVNANKETSYNDIGVELAGLVNPAYSGPDTLVFQSNQVGGALEGQGVVMVGVIGQYIGGLIEPGTPTPGNLINGNGAGLILTDCPAFTCGVSAIITEHNTVVNNNMNGNTTYGVLVVGAYQPSELTASIGSDASTANQFDSNTWNSGDTGVMGAAAGSYILDGAGWGGGCTNSCASVGLTYEGLTNFLATASVLAPSIEVQASVIGNDGFVVQQGTELTIAGSANTYYVSHQTTVHFGTSVALPIEVMNPSLPMPTPVFTVTMGSTLITLNANTTHHDTGNTYGAGALKNSCTPAGSTSSAAPGTPSNALGSADGSSSLNGFTGGVDATYIAC